MKQKVDNEFLIKRFCRSVIQQLCARNVLGTDYIHKVSVTIARFREFEKNPEKTITKENIEKYFADFDGLQEPSNRMYDYGVDNWMYTQVIGVLWDIKDYYKNRKDKQVQEKLQRSLREYFVGVSSTAFRGLLYRIVSMRQMVQLLQNQK